MTHSALAPDTRPRLLPAAVLLRRPGGDLQVGLDPGWTVPDPDGRRERWLARLDGRQPWQQLSATMLPGEVAVLRRVVESLLAAGLVVSDQGRPETLRTLRVRLVGAGPLGVAVADRLLEAGLSRLYVMDHDPARAAALRNRHPSRIRVVRHWTKPETPKIQLTLVVSDTSEADRVVTADLLRHDSPYLIVSPRPGGAVVGPLVVPGRTPCLHCCDLTRRDADPAWPQLLDQLARIGVEDRSAVVDDWVVAVSVVQAFSFLTGQQPETWGATLELNGYAMSWRPWSAHPECGCRWVG